VRTPALPLRILLVLVLILNGIGGAIASVSAALPAIPGAVPPQSAEVAVAADCGEHGAIVDTGPDTGLTVPATDCHADGSECDDGTQCLLACMHAAAAVAPLLSVMSIEAGADTVLHPLASGHPAPRLASPTRPPIG